MPLSWLGISRRRDGVERAGAPAIAVAVNTSPELRELPLPGGRVILATHGEIEGLLTGARLVLPPLGAAMVEMPPGRP